MINSSSSDCNENKLKKRNKLNRFKKLHLRWQSLNYGDPESCSKLIDEQSFKTSADFLNLPFRFSNLTYFLKKVYTTFCEEINICFVY